jgi:hypothetical protein
MTLRARFYAAVGGEQDRVLTPPTAGVKFSSIRLLVICLLTWLGAIAKKGRLLFRRLTKAKNIKKSKEKKI